MSLKHGARAVYVVGVMAGISIFWTASLNGQSIHLPAPVIVPPVVIAEPGPGPQTSSTDGGLGP
jgi:hypothetical protein